MNRKNYGKRFPLRPIVKPPQSITIINSSLDPMRVAHAIEAAKRKLDDGGCP